MRILVETGDVARVKADALITAINSGGMWFGGIDGVIRRVAGDLFHRQAAYAMPLSDGQTVVAKRVTVHAGDFGDVIFVVDDLKQPLRNVIYAGLKAAAEAGCKSVSLPMIRMGVMLGAVEKSKEEAVIEMSAAVDEFLTEPNGLEQIVFVVYNDPETEELLRRAVA